MKLRKRSASCPLNVEVLEQRTLLSAYTLTPIAESGGDFSGFASTSTSINRDGAVAFSAALATVGSGIFLGDGQQILPIATIESRFGGVGPFTSVNAAGTVAYEFKPPRFQGNCIAASDGMTTTFSSCTILGGLGLAPSLNDLWTVVYTGSGTGRPDFIATSSHDVLYDTSDGFFFSFGNPSINNFDTVAFSAGLAGAGSGIFRGDGTTLLTIADTTGPFSGFGTEPYPAINDGGTVAFFALLRDGASGIFTGDGATTTAVATTDDGFSSFGSAPAINGAGTVAFWATVAVGDSAIWAGGPDQSLCRVIGTGDAAFGSTVTALDFFRQGLNDAGQVAFFAQLADGRQVIVRADPVGNGRAGMAQQPRYPFAGPLSVLDEPGLASPGDVQKPEARTEERDAGGNGPQSSLWLGPHRNTAPTATQTLEAWLSHSPAAAASASEGDLTVLLGALSNDRLIPTLSKCF